MFCQDAPDLGSNQPQEKKSIRAHGATVPISIRAKWQEPFCQPPPKARVSLNTLPEKKINDTSVLFLWKAILCHQQLNEFSPNINTALQ